MREKNSLFLQYKNLTHFSTASYHSYQYSKIKNIYKTNLDILLYSLNCLH